MSEEINGYGIDMTPINPIEIRVNREWLKEVLLDFMYDLSELNDIDNEDVEKFVSEWLEEYEI
jgi:hypothetical protein